MKGSFKYIIVLSHATNREMAIIIPKMLSHDHCVDPKKNPPIAAGFFRIQDGFITVDGRSDSLNLYSRPQDAEIIYFTLLFSGVHGLTGPWPKDFKSADRVQQPQEVTA